MAKVKVQKEKSLEEAKEKLRGTVDFRQTTKWCVIAAKAKWSRKKKVKKI